MTRPDSDYKWWEKTVEYLFVIQYLSMIYPDNFLKIAPLDGDHEQAGDVILRDPNDKYYLIEFKKRSSSQYDEFIKFLDVKSKNFKFLKEKCSESGIAKYLSEALSNEKFDFSKLAKIKIDPQYKIKNLQELKDAKYHFVIFAKREREELFLYAQQYKDYLKKLEIFIPQTNFKKEFDENAASRDEFLAYVHEFVSLKKGKELVIVDDGESSSAFANVLAINSEGKTCTLLDIINSKIYQNKYPSLNMEMIEQYLDNLEPKINQIDMTLQEVEELNEILGKFREYLNDVQEDFKNIQNIIIKTEQSIDSLEKNLDKLKIELTPKETNSVTSKFKRK
jgi:hypothetical protein